MEYEELNELILTAYEFNREGVECAQGVDFDIDEFIQKKIDDFGSHSEFIKDLIEKLMPLCERGAGMISGRVYSGFARDTDGISCMICKVEVK